MCVCVCVNFIFIFIFFGETFAKLANLLYTFRRNVNQSSQHPSNILSQSLERLANMSSIPKILTLGINFYQ